MIDDIQQNQAELKQLCVRFGVSRLEVFGSAATGYFRAEDSDVDFLVEFVRPTERGYADRYFGLLEALEALFGRPVDLVVASTVKNPYFLQSLDRTRILLYAA